MSAGQKRRVRDRAAEEEALREGLADVAPLVEVLGDRAVANPLVVGVEVDGVVLEGVDDGLRRVDPGVHRIVDALELRHVAHADAVSAHHDAGNSERAWERPEPARWDCLGAPAHSLSALEDLLDEGVGLEQLQRVVDGERGVRVVEPRDETDTDLVLAHRVDEAAAELVPLRALAERPSDRVIHTMGWPLRKGPKWNEFGGSFIYPMGEDKVCIGFVAGLDYTDATFSVHDTLQLFKTHPFVQKILEGGKRVGWGAKTIPSGGFWALPRTFTVPGMVMCGDGVGMCNVSELKGIHYAMHAGIYAAEAIVDALKHDSVNFDAYNERVRNSAITEDLYKWRNVRQAFSKGFFFGGAVANAALLTRGHLPPGRWHQHLDAEEAMELDGASKHYPKPDNKYTFDKLSSVFASGNATRDDAPNHIKVQRRVPREVAQTWVSMCPAQVYEIPDEQVENGAAEVDLTITPSNCVQCGAITAKGGRLTPPEGGDGPLYQET